jgi:hypothetical protein
VDEFGELCKVAEACIRFFAVLGRFKPKLLLLEAHLRRDVVLEAGPVLAFNQTSSESDRSELADDGRPAPAPTLLGDMLRGLPSWAAVGRRADPNNGPEADHFEVTLAPACSGCGTGAADRPTFWTGSSRRFET